MRPIATIISRCCLLLLMAAAGCSRDEVRDEALTAGRDAASLPAADEDFFREMDNGVTLTADEIKGRNNWAVWTAGNDRFWDTIAQQSAGTLDFLKTLSSHPSLKFNRSNRWRYLGVVNEPCFDGATGPDPNRFGLWLDTRRTGPGCPPDPFENEQKYPGVRIGARGTTVPVGSLYGYATGVVGLRLFPNPEFDEDAARQWDAEQYYKNPAYYDSKHLIKPYRVGMSCGFCHIGMNPVKPPEDPEHPRWENLSSNVGAQYFWVDRIFDWRADEHSFMFQLFHASRPGTLDTSLISTDSINNPRTMNAVYNLGARLGLGRRLGRETISGGALNSKQFNDYVRAGPLAELFEPPATVYTPRVLKDGADSIGALGALNRVYINIGLFGEEWMRHFNPLVGGRRVTPIDIASAREHSSYWQANEAQTPAVALFFLKTTQPHALKDAPGGAAHLQAAASVMDRGKTVFADTCARCHSSKLPPLPPELTLGACAGPGYLDCWNAYWRHTKTEDFKRPMREIVRAADFLDDNFLSTDVRVPVTLLQTNACSPLATNAIRGNIWDNFSSESYKQLPSVGSVVWYHPYDGSRRDFAMPAGGRGYTRPASLVSLWSTAPYLLNNTVGRQSPDEKPFERLRGSSPSPSVDARLWAFQDGIEKLLWPELREKDSLLGDKIPGVIDRTTATSYVRVPTGYLPDGLRSLLGLGRDWLPWLFNDDGIELGPIPKGTPVALLSNLRLLSESTAPGDRAAHLKTVLSLLRRAKDDLKALPADATDAQAAAAFADLVEPLLNLSTCPDFIVNRGHYFGTAYLGEEQPLSDSDKRALIAFLKTF
jgi:hypothetical protein